MATSHDTNLADANPEVALLWHPSKNGGLKPTDVAPSSRKTVWWLCNKKHEWQSSVSNLARGRRCPFCARKRISRDSSFAALHPAAAALWHPTRNLKFTPETLGPKSNKVVWWVCPKGHEWQAKVEHLGRGCGCPYCSGHRVCADNNLGFLMPDVALRWHPTQNGTLTPFDVVPGSDKNVWWLCGKGHVWRARVASMTKERGIGCKLCQAEAASERNRKRGITNSGSLADTFPNLAAEWHQTRNGRWTPHDVSPKSGKRIWWICQRGHEWATRVITRTRQETGCPECSPQTSKLEIRLLCELRALFRNVEWRKRIEGHECDILLPDYRTVIELDGYPWHDKKESRDRAKNAALHGQGLTVLRVRDERLGRIQSSDLLFSPRANSLQITETVVSHLLRLLPVRVDERSACEAYVKAACLVADDEYRRMIALLPSPPPEDSLATLRPDIAAQWHPTKNDPLEPRMFSLGSNKKIWWRCGEGHDWRATVVERTKGRGCPICSRKSKGQTYRRLAVKRKGSLAQTNPTLAAEWHPTRNSPLTPHDRSAGSQDKVWWSCALGHEWLARINSRTKGNGCPHCYNPERGSKILRGRLKHSGSLAQRHPDVAACWHPTLNGSRQPTDVTSGSNFKAYWTCPNGHTFQMRISNRVGGGLCPQCRGDIHRQNAVRRKGSLAERYPWLAAEWHPSRNEGLSPSDRSCGSQEKVWWRCCKGHEWKTSIVCRTKGTGCPYCAKSGRAKVTHDG